MRRSSTYLLICFILPFCTSCTEEDPIMENRISIETDTSAIGIIALQDRWIYTEMAQNYFWADRMKDSLDCDYSLPPDQFFKSLIVDEDRFSYCYPNGNYRPNTKGTNLNDTVKLDSIYVISGKRVGYFYYSGFETEADVTDVILRMRGIDELIIDVRNNPGGYIATCIYLSSLIAPGDARGKVFCSYRYNNRISRINKEKTGDECTYSYFRDDVLTTNRSLSLKRLFILTGPRSASASELLINCLKPYMPVIVIGSITTGKDVGMRPLSSTKCQYVLNPITFRTYNVDGVPVPITGIVPDYQYDADSVSGRIGDIHETLLGKAIEEIIKTNNTQ